jgi:hypothetical protein
MLLPLVLCIVAYPLALACWRILRRLVVKTDLDNVPGPASHSFLKGASRLTAALSFGTWLIRVAGNFSKVVNVNAWDYHKELSQKCKLFIRSLCICEGSSVSRSDGRVARINAVLGVWRYLLQGDTTNAFLRKSSSMSLIRRPCIKS